METIRITQADREFFVQLLAEYGLSRSGVQNAVDAFLVEKGWESSRDLRVKLLSRMRVCNPNYSKCKPEWRAFYDRERQRLREATSDRHLTRAVARDRHLEKVMREALVQLEAADGKSAGAILRSIAELIKTELEVERHERGAIRDGDRQTDTGNAGDVKSAGSGGLVRELVSALESLGEREDDV